MNIENLTFSQTENFLRDQISPDTDVNTLAAIVNIDDSYSYAAINNVLNKLVENFDAYRIRITKFQNTIKQYIQKFEFQNFPIVEFDNDEVYKTWVQEQKCKCIFDYNSALYEFKIIKRENGKLSVLFLQHHSIADGWSLVFAGNYIMNSLLGKYIPENKYSYMDSVKREQKYLKSKRFELDRDYWKNKLSKYDNSTFSVASNNVEPKAVMHSYKLTEKEIDSLQKICKDFSVSVSVLYSSLVHLYISDLLKNNNNSIGLIFHNRKGNIEKSMCGMFARVLPLIIEIDYNHTVEEFLNFVRKESFNLMKHGKYPFCKIIEENENTENLVKCLVSYQNKQRDSEIKNKGFSDEWLENETMTNTLNIHLNDRYNENAMNVRYDFNVQYFSESHIESMHHHLMSIIEQFSNSYQTCLKDIEVTKSMKV